MNEQTAVLERDPDLDVLRTERTPRSILLESDRFYTALGVMLEDRVRGLVREWAAGR